MDVLQPLIGCRIKLLREKIGMSQAELAEACNIEANSISRYETGANPPSMEHLLTLASALKVSPIAILSTQYLEDHQQPDASGSVQKNNASKTPNHAEQDSLQMEAFKQKLGDTIRKIRKKKNKNQIELAKEVGVDKNTISRYENGKTAPSIEHFLNLASALEISPMQLIPDLNSGTHFNDIIRKKISKRIQEIESTLLLQEILHLANSQNQTDRNKKT